MAKLPPNNPHAPVSLSEYQRSPFICNVTKSIQRGEMPKTTQQFTDCDYTVGWICALPETDLVASAAMLDEEHPTLPAADPQDANSYLLGHIGECSEDEEDSDDETKDTQDLRLWDVVVSLHSKPAEAIVQYDFGKSLQGKEVVHTGGKLNKPPGIHLSAVGRLQAQHALKGHGISELLIKMRSDYPASTAKFQTVLCALRWRLLVCFTPTYGISTSNLYFQGLNGFISLLCHPRYFQLC
ncbi:hypothetical protein AO1008_10716 [Aspergillus oryzae 100-8]|uniref:Uncharacterized protein n=1 Tax=Aspergillus oryzae (strain 3.042) TaxID=1160506 RepID=I7ZXL3_ASPO3|nr:hypothetical protein Ao3042_06834 [Aspergillus oryzae 3.042]KDE84164.1 hypothetical protein AO1008_10716 [Aspergillus oryzae 100-8]|eukprot:EIT76984.1 hypothetical protein Ao3042_06834 [Aspergillus oryzae 3.042]